MKNIRREGKFEETVHESPEEIGVDAPALVQQYPDETYNVGYSILSCLRLLKEAGLSYQKPRPTAAESGAEKQETFREKLKKRWEMNVTVVCVDQTRKSA